MGTNYKKSSGKGIIIPYGDGPELLYKENIAQNVYLNTKEKRPERVSDCGESSRFTPGLFYCSYQQEIYMLRKETIGRLFGSAKEQHGFLYKKYGSLYFYKKNGAGAKLRHQLCLQSESVGLTAGFCSILLIDYTYTKFTYYDFRISFTNHLHLKLKLITCKINLK